MLERTLEVISCLTKDSIGQVHNTILFKGIIHIL